MFKTILIFYIICFALYIFFSRQPDYLDGNFVSGTIHFVKDSTQKLNPEVFFTVDTTAYAAKADYPLRRIKENEIVPVIYDTSKPAYAAVYKWWGYWLQWDELMASLLIPFILFQAAKAITGHPTPESIIEELENEKPVKRKKYH